jgi:uncharacterized damage-inducible protein DinB
MNLGVAARRVLGPGVLDVAVPPIEVGSLEGVRGNKHLGTATSPRLHLGGRNQSTPEASTAQVWSRLDDEASSRAMHDPKSLAEWDHTVHAMSRSLLEDAFAHHVWATLRLLDGCLPLSPQQLETAVPGTYGSILDTQRHLVGADSSYLFVTSGERTPLIDEDHMGLPELRTAMEGHGTAWSRLLAEDFDPDAVLVRRRDDGSETHAPMGIRLAQALHHGTDHRSQICTALTTFGVEPPAIDVWDFGVQDGRVTEVPPRT